MVWIVIGTGTKTEHVPGGARVEKECSECGEWATFAERRMTRTLRLYFVDVLAFDAQRVMACGSCGALFATDDADALGPLAHGGWRGTLGAAAEGVSGAMEKAGQALSPMLERVGEAVGPLAKRATDGAASLAGAAVDESGPLARNASKRAESTVRGVRRPARTAERESEHETDPEKRALLRKFEALERESGSGARASAARGPATDRAPASERETDPEKRALLRKFEALERALEDEKKKRDA